jgi:hypothetical protein
MRAVLDALSLSVVLVVLPWLLIQMGIGAALAFRHDISPAVGAAFGLIPIPCVGWLCVLAKAKRPLHVTDDDYRPIGKVSTETVDDDGW